MKKNRATAIVTKAVRDVLTLLGDKGGKIEVGFRGPTMDVGVNSDVGNYVTTVNGWEGSEEKELRKVVASMVSLNLIAQNVPQGEHLRRAERCYASFGPNVPLFEAAGLQLLLDAWDGTEDADKLFKKLTANLYNMIPLLIKAKKEQDGVHVPVPEGARNNGAEEDVGTASKEM